MDRGSLHVGGTYRFTVECFDSSGNVVAQSSAPSFVVVKNGTPTLDSVTAVNRDSDGKHYDCSYNPSGEVETDHFEIRVTVSIASVNYKRPSEHFDVIAIERGTDDALKPTTAGRTLDVTAGGCAGIDWANVEAPSTSLVLSGTTISTSQQVASVSGAVGSVTGNVGGSVASVNAGVTVTTNNDKTGYSLATAPPTAAAIADAVLDEAIADHLTAGSLGAGINSLLSRITSTLFSGITSLGQWLGAMAGKQTPDSTALAEINATGAGSGTFAGGTADSLEAIRDRGDAAWATGAGGGGSVSISITPLKGQQEQRVIDSDLVGYINDRSSIGTIAVTEDDEVTPVDVSAFAANARIWIEPSSGTGTRYTVTPTVSGDDGNLISFTLPAAVVATKSTWLWSLRDITGASAGEGRHVIGGTLTIKRAARAPA